MNIKINPVRVNAIVTPTDRTHPWFGQILRVTEDSGGDHVSAQIQGRTGNSKQFPRMELAAISSTHGKHIARAVGKQLIRQRR